MADYNILWKNYKVDAIMILGIVANSIQVIKKGLSEEMIFEFNDLKNSVLWGSERRVFQNLLCTKPCAGYIERQS